MYYCKHLYLQKTSFMKCCLLPLLFIFFVVSCRDRGSTNEITRQVHPVNISPYPAELAKPVPVRNVSITPANAYNNLFLDSSVLETFIRNENLSEAQALELKNFYYPRNLEYAWFSEDGLTEEGRNFWNAYDYGSKAEPKDSATIATDKWLAKRMNTLLQDTLFQANETDTSVFNTEIALTLKFIEFYKNTEEPNAVTNAPLRLLLPAKKTDAITLADSVLAESDTDTANSNQNPYTALKKQLAIYVSIAKQGGWQLVSITKKLKKGGASLAVTGIKKRLQLSGDMPGTDTSSTFNDTLETAVKSFQERMGFKPDGIVTESLVKEMNVPVTERIGKILINMNRMLWIPAQLPDNYIQVNIPEFMLYVYEGQSKAFDMEVVVGREGSHTMMFTGNLNRIVFSPYWNVPASIVRNEILPSIRRDPNYLKNHNMEIVGGPDSLPRIRQLPGPGNSLGKVKFLFPNSYDIYLHDTEAKELFSFKKRAFSHGCIRLADAEKMANYLLRSQKEWNPEKINAAMNNNKEQWVKVKQPVPVLITYFTTWADENGKINFREDIYGHDAAIADKLFADESL